MPQISRFLGIIIKMFFDDHNPPHFHAEYNEYKAEIGINDLTVLRGELPARILGLVVEWAELHKVELHDNWQRMENEQPFNDIAPLI